MSLHFRSLFENVFAKCHRQIQRLGIAWRYDLRCVHATVASDRVDPLKHILVSRGSCSETRLCLTQNRFGSPPQVIVPLVVMPSTSSIFRSPPWTISRSVYLNNSTRNREVVKRENTAREVSLTIIHTETPVPSITTTNTTRHHRSVFRYLEGFQQVPIVP